MKHSRYLLIAAALAAVLAVQAASPVSPAWIKSESLPLGLYLATRYEGGPLARGQLACFPYENPSWAKKKYLYKGEIVCKYILGVPGDVLTTLPTDIHQVCHKNQCTGLGLILRHDANGRAVDHPVWTHFTIPEQTYYLGSTRRPNSLDSRYLGLIHRNKIVKTLVPLLVEQDH